MKLLFKLLIIPICFLGLSLSAGAQTAKIMDTGIDWTNSGGGGMDGNLKVFLTDTIGVTGLTVSYGSTDSTDNYYGGTYSIPGSFQAGGGSIQEGELTLPIGHFTESITGYLRVTILFTGGGHSEIAVVK